MSYTAKPAQLAKLQEQKHHGTARFPFNLYPCTIPGDFPQVALHWQASMELVYVKKGAGVVQVGLQSWQAAPGDIYLMPPGTLHALRQAPGQAMEYENIIFDLALLGGAEDTCAERYLLPLQSGRLVLPPCLRPGQPGHADAVACLAAAEQASRSRAPGYELAIKGALLLFLAPLVAAGDAPAPVETTDTRRLKQALQLVAQRYAQPLTVGEMAAACGVSPSHFMRWFKRMTGQRFTEYLNDHRLNAAAEALRTTDTPILSIAEQSGFDNLSYFNRQFKRRYHVTPREYRKGS